MKLTRLVPLMCALAAPALAQAQGTAAIPGSHGTKPVPSAPVIVRTSVSKTAVWVGDRMTYTIELQCAPQVEILADDLATERLRVAGLEILGVETQRDASVPDQVTHRWRYNLVTYATDIPTLKIQEIPVRYYVRRPGQRTEDAVPSGEVKVPPLVVAVRSTLPDESGARIAIRDARPVEPLPLRLRLAQQVGLGLLLLAAAPVALWTIDIIQRLRKSRARSRGTMTRQQRRTALQHIRELDVNSEPQRRVAYAQLDAWIRENVQHATGVLAPALTPGEIPIAAKHPPRALRLKEIHDVLVECERAKYSPEPIASGQWESMLQEAEQLLAADRR